MLTLPFSSFTLEAAPSITVTLFTYVHTLISANSALPAFVNNLAQQFGNNAHPITNPESLGPELTSAI